MDISRRISADPAICHGAPVVKGSRVPVSTVLGQLAAGLTPDAVAQEYGIDREDVLAALAYAAQTVGEEEIRAG